MSATNDMAETWQNETRGQAWQSVIFSSDSIHVVGLYDDVEAEQLRAYVADLIAAANAELGERRLRGVMARTSMPRDGCRQRGYER